LATYTVPGFDNLTTFNLDALTVMQSADAQQKANGYQSAPAPADFISQIEAADSPTDITLEQLLFFKFSGL